MFNSRRLSLARRRRRLTGKALAELAGLAADTISRLENGIVADPGDETVSQIAGVLGFPVAFFFEDDPHEVDTAAVSFRSFSKMSAKERDAATSAGALGLHLNDWIEQRFNLPTVNLIDLSYETDPTVAASNLRQFWNIGERPIGNLLGLLESNGIKVFSLSENTASVNAFSFWRDDKPFIFLNNFKTAESSIFDTAHELGHLVLHRHAGSNAIRSSEREADSFASAFLMPSNDVRSRLPAHITIDLVLRAKKRWRVSAMAMAYRLKSLELLSEWQYKSTCIELSKRGYRSSEPDGIEREKSPVWQKVLNQLWKERVTKSEIAESLKIPLDELEGLIWNLVGSSELPDSKTQSGLSIVEN